MKIGEYQLRLGKCSPPMFTSNKTDTQSSNKYGLLPLWPPYYKPVFLLVVVSDSYFILFL